MAKSKLQAELRKKQPFDTLEQEAYLNIVRTNNLLMVPFNKLFREHGITPAQYNILRILRGHADMGLPSLEIASQMVTCVPDITRLIDRLEQSGYVTRERSAEDRRVVRVNVTAQGLDLLANLDEPLLALHRSCLGHLTKQELKDINRVMVRAREIVSGPPAP